jgi:hypothetical protein
MDARKVEAANGWLWIKQGWALFQKNFLLWVVLVAIGSLGLNAIGSIPRLGDPLATLLSTVLFGGLLMGCRAQEKGEKLELAHLFAGLRHSTTQLVALGGITMVCKLLINAIAQQMGGGKPIVMTENTDPQVLIDASIAGGVSAILACIALLLLSYAPMLVIFNGLSPIAAMKASWRACWRNVGPLLVYGLVLLPLCFVASLPIIQASTQAAPPTLSSLLLFGWLILGPLLLTSMYASYRDLFPTISSSAQM